VEEHEIDSIGKARLLSLELAVNEENVADDSISMRRWEKPEWPKMSMELTPA